MIENFANFRGPWTLNRSIPILHEFLMTKNSNIYKIKNLHSFAVRGHESLASSCYGPFKLNKSSQVISMRRRQLLSIYLQKTHIGLSSYFSSSFYENFLSPKFEVSLVLNLLLKNHSIEKNDKGASGKPIKLRVPRNLIILDRTPNF